MSRLVSGVNVQDLTTEVLLTAVRFSRFLKE